MSETNERNPLPQWDSFIAAHSVGDLVDGEVTSVVHFGAFVDVGGIAGLVHTSEMVNPLRMGDRLRVRIADVDLDRRRLSLVPA